MSESIRTEEQRKIAELESLVAGLAHHVDHLEDQLDACHGTNDSLTFELAQAAWKLHKAEKELVRLTWTQPQEC